MRRAFTLLEVNLAIAVMAGGLLSTVVLFTLGFSESRQSVEDVASAAYADAVISPLASVITATNLKWSVFREIESFPRASGNSCFWGLYVDMNGRVRGGSPDETARSAFSQAMQAYKGAADGGLSVGTGFPVGGSGNVKVHSALLVLHEPDSPLVRIAYRAVSTPSLLMSSPVYYTELRFQGLYDK